MTDGGALPAWFSRTLDGLRRPARRHGHRRAGVRRRPGGHQRAQRAARRPARARRRRGDRRAGPGQPRHRHAAGASPASPSARRSTRSAALGGRPVGSLRISDADPRPRHRGVSHHSLTAYGRVALAAGGPGRARGPGAGARRSRSRRALAPLAARHRIVRVATDGLDAALRAAAGAAVHDGPRPRRRPRLLPGRRGRRPARRHPARPDASPLISPTRSTRVEPATDRRRQRGPRRASRRVARPPTIAPARSAPSVGTATYSPRPVDASISATRSCARRRRQVWHARATLDEQSDTSHGVARRRLRRLTRPSRSRQVARRGARDRRCGTPVTCSRSAARPARRRPGTGPCTARCAGPGRSA